MPATATAEEPFATTTTTSEDPFAAATITDNGGDEGSFVTTTITDGETYVTATQTGMTSATSTPTPVPNNALYLLKKWIPIVGVTVGILIIIIIVSFCLHQRLRRRRRRRRTLRQMRRSAIVSLEDGSFVVDDDAPSVPIRPEMNSTIPFAAEDCQHAIDDSPSRPLVAHRQTTRLQIATTAMRSRLLARASSHLISTLKMDSYHLFTFLLLRKALH